MVLTSHMNGTAPCLNCFASRAQLRRPMELHVSCEVRTPRTRGDPVVMRDLPLPGQPANRQARTQTLTTGPPPKQQNQLNGNGSYKQTQHQHDRDQDQARRSSNAQASTSSYSYGQQRLPSATQFSRNGSRPDLDAFEASTAMEQAAPGFQAAAQQASASSAQLAYGLQAEQGTKCHRQSQAEMYCYVTTLLTWYTIRQRGIALLFSCSCQHAG